MIIAFAGELDVMENGFIAIAKYNVPAYHDAIRVSADHECDTWMIVKETFLLFPRAKARSLEINDLILIQMDGARKTTDQNYEAMCRNGTSFLIPLNCLASYGISRKSMIYKTLNKFQHRKLL